MSSDDHYRTLATPGTGLFKAKGSKHYAYAYPINDEQQVATYVKTLRDQHHKARHHCYAYRLGDDGSRWRANDDGEPNNSAGQPILGQLDARGITDALVVVVRYFGGTKLGMSGLIEAYREAAALALDDATSVERVRQSLLLVRTDYAHLADLMNAVKAGPWTVVEQVMELEVNLTLSCARSAYPEAYAALWRTLAGVYPGEERLTENPPGYTIRRPEVDR